MHSIQFGQVVEGTVSDSTQLQQQTTNQLALPSVRTTLAGCVTKQNIAITKALFQITDGIKCYFQTEESGPNVSGQCIPSRRVASIASMICLLLCEPLLFALSID
mgnify:CR=1 FL=1